MRLPNAPRKNNNKNSNTWKGDKNIITNQTRAFENDWFFYSKIIGSDLRGTHGRHFLCVFGLPSCRGCCRRTELLFSNGRITGALNHSVINMYSVPYNTLDSYPSNNVLRSIIFNIIKHQNRVKMGVDWNGHPSDYLLLGSGLSITRGQYQQQQTNTVSHISNAWAEAWWSHCVRCYLCRGSVFGVVIVYGYLVWV